MAHFKGIEVVAWLAVGLYVAAIFLMLPFAPRLWSVLLTYFRISFRGATAFVLLFPVAGCSLSMLRHAGRTPPFPLQRMTGLLFLVALAWVTVSRLAETPAEALHLLEYGGLGYLTMRAATLHSRSARSSLLCFLFVLCVGSLDEAIQFVLPNRIFQVKDILLNGMCGAIGLTTAIVLHFPSITLLPPESVTNRSNTAPARIASP